MKKLFLLLLILCIAVNPDVFGQRKKSRKKLRAKNVDTLIVEVDQLSLKELVDTGKYSYVDKEITEKYFNVQVVGKPKTDTVLLIYFAQTLTSESVLSKMEQGGVYPATIEHLLAVGAKYPELQKQFPVAALGSVNPDKMVPLLEYNTGTKETNQQPEKKIIQKKNKEIVVVMEEMPDERDVILVEWEGSWRPTTRFIGVLHKPPKSFLTETIRAR